MDLVPEVVKAIAENIVLFGAAAMGIFYGVKRVYTTARNVERLIESADKNKESLTTLGNELRAHVKMEEDRDLIRDQQLIQLSDHMEEVVAEMRPNGGSSMKDILTKASQKVDEVHTRVSVIEQWKNDHVLETEALVKAAAVNQAAKAARKAKPKKMMRRNGRP